MIAYSGPATSSVPSYAGARHATPVNVIFNVLDMFHLVDNPTLHDAKACPCRWRCILRSNSELRGANGTRGRKSRAKLPMQFRREQGCSVIGDRPKSADHNRRSAVEKRSGNRHVAARLSVACP